MFEQSTEVLYASQYPIPSSFPSNSNYNDEDHVKNTSQFEKTASAGSRTGALSFSALPIFQDRADKNIEELTISLLSQMSSWRNLACQRIMSASHYNMTPLPPPSQHSSRSSNYGGTTVAVSRESVDGEARTVIDETLRIYRHELRFSHTNLCVYILN